jgi:hypothetical protein
MVMAKPCPQITPLFSIKTYLTRSVTEYLEDRSATYVQVLALGGLEEFWPAFQEICSLLKIVEAMNIFGSGAVVERSIEGSQHLRTPRIFNGIV